MKGWPGASDETVTPSLALRPPHHTPRSLVKVRLLGAAAEHGAQRVAERAGEADVLQRLGLVVQRKHAGLRCGTMRYGAGAVRCGADAVLQPGRDAWAVGKTTPPDGGRPQVCRRRVGRCVCTRACELTWVPSGTFGATKPWTVRIGEKSMESSVGAGDSEAEPPGAAAAAATSTDWRRRVRRRGAAAAAAGYVAAAAVPPAAAAANACRLLAAPL